MNKFRNAKIIALLGLGTLAIGATTTFADETGVNTNQNRPAMVGKQARGGSGALVGSGREMQGQMGENFFASTLTDEQKTAAKAIQDAYRTKLKNFYDTNSGSLEETSIVEALTALQNEHIANMTSYIDSTKLEQFKEMAKKQHPKMNNQNRGQKTAQTTQKSATVLNVEKVIEKKLATLTTDEAKISWLTTLNTKVEALSAKVTSQKSKTLLGAIQDVINEQLDILNGNTIDEDMIDDLLE